MTPKEIYEIADSLAPFAASDEFCRRYGHHDNSGLLVDCGEEATGVLFSLDLSARAVEVARDKGCNVIFTHHPAIWIDGLPRLDETCGKHVLACARAGISVLSAHLNLDAAAGGIDASLMQGLGGEREIAVMEPVEDGAYGRVYDVKSCTLADFVKKIKRNFSTQRMLRYGDSPVCRVASICGAGFSDEVCGFALAHGADTVVTSDAAHHRLLGAVECGLNVVLLTHYAAEAYGFLRFAEQMKARLSCPVYCLRDERFM